MVYAFKVEMEETATKNIFRNKRTANKVSLIFLDVKSAYRKATIAFLYPVKKQARCSVCIYF